MTPRKNFTERQRTDYDELRELLARHPDPEVRRSIPFCYSPFLDDEPYPFPLDLLTEGMLVLAPTGSGKSSYFLDPLITSVAHHDVNVIAINFKESATSRENARVSTEEAGKEFEYFTTQEGYPSRCMNLVQNLLDGRTPGMTSMLRAEIAMGAMGHNHGRGYGRSHYFHCNLLAGAVLFRPDLLPPGKQNFRELARLLLEPKKLALPDVFAEALKESVTDVLSTCLSLGDLNVTNNERGIDPGEHVDLDRIAEAGSGVVAWLELPYGSRPEAAYLAAQAVVAKLSHALGRMPSTSKLTHLLVIDDAEPIFSPLFTQLLHVARSKGLGIVISLQGRHQAASGTEDFWPSLESYAATKVLLGVEDTELFDWINKTAGRVRRARLSYEVPYQDDLEFGDLGPQASLPGVCYPENTASYLSPPLAKIAVSMIEESRFEGNNEIMLASARGDMSFVRVRKNSGPWQHHGRTIPVLLKHHIDKAEYERREMTGAPRTPGSVTVTASDPLAEFLAEYGRRQGRVAETWKRPGPGNRDRQRPRHGEGG